MSGTYRRPPLTVTAIQVAAGHGGRSRRLDAADWCGGFIAGTLSNPCVWVPAADDDLLAHPGDWILRRPDGSFEVLPDDEFGRHFVGVAACQHCGADPGQVSPT